MSKRCLLCLGFMAVMGSVWTLPGCGDKFLVASRGTRFQRAPAGRQAASILIYTNPSSEIAKAFAGVGVDEALRKAGHRTTVVTNVAEFQAALGRGGWDLVVAGLGDARAIHGAERNFGVLPVVVNPTAEEWKESRKLYPVVLRAPAKSPAVVEAVDEALASRPKSAQKSAKAAI